MVLTLVRYRAIQPYWKRAQVQTDSPTSIYYIIYYESKMYLSIYWADAQHVVPFQIAYTSVLKGDINLLRAVFPANKNLGKKKLHRHSIKYCDIFYYSDKLVFCRWTIKVNNVISPACWSSQQKQSVSYLLMMIFVLFYQRWNLQLIF